MRRTNWLKAICYAQWMTIVVSITSLLVVGLIWGVPQPLLGL